MKSSAQSWKMAKMAICLLGALVLSGTIWSSDLPTDGSEEREKISCPKCAKQMLKKSMHDHFLNRHYKDSRFFNRAKLYPAVYKKGPFFNDEFACPLCNTSCDGALNMKSHLEQNPEHSNYLKEFMGLYGYELERKKFTCDICFIPYNYRQDLEKHQDRAHSNTSHDKKSEQYEEKRLDKGAMDTESHSVTSFDGHLCQDNYHPDIGASDNKKSEQDKEMDEDAMNTKPPSGTSFAGHQYHDVVHPVASKSERVQEMDKDAMDTEFFSGTINYDFPWETYFPKVTKKSEEKPESRMNDEYLINSFLEWLPQASKKP